MQKLSMRFMINICLIILLILTVVMGYKTIAVGHYKLFAIIMIALAAMAMKNNIRSATLKLVITIVASVAAILAYLFL